MNFASLTPLLEIRLAAWNLFFNCNRTSEKRKGKIMKLIYLTQKDNFYVAKALQESKLLGIIFSRKIREYEFEEDKQEWMYRGNGKKVSRTRQKYLNKWLEDHKKFIEKR